MHATTYGFTVLLLQATDDFLEQFLLLHFFMVVNEDYYYMLLPASGGSCTCSGLSSALPLSFVALLVYLVYFLLELTYAFMICVLV